MSVAMWNCHFWPLDVSSSGPLAEEGLPAKFCVWGSICLLYICIVLDLAVGVAVLHIYMQCSGMQGLYAWLTGEDLCSIAFCYVDIFGVAVFNASMLNWLGGVHLPSRYMHCPRSSSWWSSMQGICAQLTWEDLCWIVLCFANMFGVAVCMASVLDWLGRTSVGLHCAMLICLV